MHTFITLREAEGLDDLTAEARALDQGALTAIAFNEPKRLKEEYARHRRRVERMADPDGVRRAKLNAQALKQGEEIIRRGNP